jgi:Fe-S-cluster-containing hydrogenase component 2
MIRIRSSRCTECQICMQICSWTHWKEINPKRSRILVEAEWPENPSIRVCVACKDRECISACPTGALRWEDWVRMDPGLCDSCGACVTACPVRGIEMDPATRFPLICDTCQGDFACITWCPTKAIERSTRP